MRFKLVQLNHLFQRVQNHITHHMGIFPQMYSNVWCKNYALTFRNAEATWKSATKHYTCDLENRLKLWMSF